MRITLKEIPKRDLFSKNVVLLMLSKSIDSLASVIEFGPNIGANLIALHTVPNLQSTGIEINKKAVKRVEKESTEYRSYPMNQFWTVEITKEYELSLIKGSFNSSRSICPRFLFTQKHAASSKYILVAEYYSPVPVELDYRGNSGKLFKRDFAGEILEKYKDLSHRRLWFCV